MSDITISAQFWRDVCTRLKPHFPNDIRAAGWAVAVHNDYRQDGKTMTFWLFTKDGRAVKGEGQTDGEALDQVRAQLREMGEAI